jgi:hypothetical protein
MTTEIINEQTHNTNSQQKKELLAKDEQQIQQDLSLSPLNDSNNKFPLENTWSFWFYKNEKSKGWKDNVKFLTSVDFIEDFWGYVLILIDNFNFNFGNVLLIIFLIF